VNGTWKWKGAKGAERRAGPWRTIEGEGRRSKPGTPPAPPARAYASCRCSKRLDMDIRDRVATPDDWYSPFREATWEDASS